MGIPNKVNNECIYQKKFNENVNPSTHNWQLNTSIASTEYNQSVLLLILLPVVHMEMQLRHAMDWPSFGCDASKCWGYSLLLYLWVAYLLIQYNQTADTLSHSKSIPVYWQIHIEVENINLKHQWQDRQLPDNAGKKALGQDALVQIYSYLFFNTHQC